MDTAVAQGSRIGFKGVEDLGGGLTALFTIENGFNADTGQAAQGGLLFGRTAIVGLSGSKGTVYLGAKRITSMTCRPTTAHLISAAWSTTSMP